MVVSRLPFPHLHQYRAARDSEEGWRRGGYKQRARSREKTRNGMKATMWKRPTN
jgi:hypothetical protein